MKRTFSRLVPLLLPACMTGAPVDSEDRLGAELESWCESLCAKANDCGASDEPATCPDACVEYFRENFAGKGDACEDAAARVMDCFELASCEALTSGDACNVTAEERRCSGSTGLVTCDATWGSASASSFACDVGYDECSDGKSYALSCSGPDDAPECTCTTDGVPTGRFKPSQPVCPLPEDAPRICGWPFTDGGGPRPTTCNAAAGSGSAGGAGVNECEVSFGACSDGREYGVACAGPPGSVVCTCAIDGAPTGTFESAAGICDATDLDNGSTAANYTCGFNLAPFGP